MKTGTVSELRLAARILRETDCRDADLTVRLHEMAREIEAIAPQLIDGVPIDLRLNTLAQVLSSGEQPHGIPPSLDFE